MKRNRFTDEQIIGILKEQEAGTPVSELCRDARQCCLERPFGKEVVTPASKRKAVAHLMSHHEMSERRACKAIGFAE